MSELENMSYSELWGKVKELRDDGVDIGELKYGSSDKEDFIKFIQDHAEEPEAEVPEEPVEEEAEYSKEDEERVKESLTALGYIDSPEEEEEDELEIKTIEDVPDEDIHFVHPEETGKTMCGIEWETSKHKITGNGNEVTCADCEEELDKYIAEQELDIEEEEADEAPVMEEKPILVEPKPKPKVYRLHNDKDIRAFLGKQVEFKMDWFKGTTTCLISESFVIKKLQKGVTYRGKLTPTIYKWIRTKRVKIVRW